MNQQQSDVPPSKKTQFTGSVDNLIHQTISKKPNMSEFLIQEILEASGFQTNDQNCHKLIAHLTDKWMIEMTDSMVQKLIQDRMRKKEKDPDEKLQLTTNDIVNELDQRGLKLQNPFQYPEIDANNLQKVKNEAQQ
ncbi:unnamed protein product (macronuclear) [Paramecium tetraurelia]|uniref:Transcription initiation factor TFIID subunit 12 domain-containing protein n=1 Tax=Paramecium tetraurelia TaxID=5888 RepID=A0DAV0_PARTE|nr:uncharacterized protein GSPATT00015074001 [Paramecium tetraurelia]CAK80167.1 unnamed protein product [Paramecium tetraurelia]|eukprot:XP_001447564.1 hypothetical protein (macronuclear) [Paramecium tetraurelia strain d4-2]